MNRTTRIKITELNPHVICVLCGGYFINATTITECLHSFCRTCITRYLETSKYCPVCDVMVHKTRPLDYIRSDKTLQDLVYKLVPGLYKSEMKRRREYYAAVDTPGVTQPPSEDRGDEFFDRIIYTEDEKISLSLELCAEGIPFKTPINVHGHTGPENIRIKDVRYLQCPAAFSIGNLKKFIRMKFDLKLKFEIDIFHTAEPLPEYYSLMDIAYIYTWTRRAPLRLYYTVFERKLPPKAPDLISRDQSNKVNNNNKQERDAVPAKNAKADDKYINRKRKLLEGPDDISPDLDFDKCKPYKGDRRKGLGTPKKRAKKTLEVDDTVNEAMSESEEQLAKLTLDCSGDTRGDVGKKANVKSKVNEHNKEGDADEIDESDKTDDVNKQKENVKNVVKTSSKTKRDENCTSETLTSITIETNTQVRGAESDINGTVQTEKDSSSSKQSSAQVSPGSGSISLSLFQPLNPVSVETLNETVDKPSDKKNDNTFEFQSEESGIVSPKKARGRPKGSKNKVTSEKTGNIKSKSNEVKADQETKTSFVASKNHPGLKSPKANKTQKISETKSETPSKKKGNKAKVNSDDNKVPSTDKTKPVNGEKVKRKYVRKNKAANAGESGREAKCAKKDTRAVENKRDVENLPSLPEGVKERLDVNNTRSDIDVVSDSVSDRSKDITEKEVPQKQSEVDKVPVEKANNEMNQEKQSAVTSSSLQEPVTPMYGETPKVNESNQGLPCSPNMDSFDDSGRLVIDTSVNNEDMDGAKTKEISDKTVVKSNKAQSNGAISENINVKGGDIVSNRALSKEMFRNGFGIYDGSQSVNTSGNNSDIPNAHTDQFRHVINGLSHSNTLNILGGFSPPPMTAHVHIGNVTNTTNFPSHDQNFDQPLDLTNNGAREEYTKGKIFKTKMLKKTYPKQDSVQYFKEKGTNSVNQFLH